MNKTKNQTKVIVGLLSVIFICIVILTISVLGSRFGFSDRITTTPEKYKYRTGFFASNDLSIYDSQKKSKINIGMKKEDVEKVLGTPNNNQNDGLLQMTNYNEISIKYRDDKVVGITLTSNSNNRFVTMRNLGINSTTKEVETAYGSIENTTKQIDYLIEKNGSNYKYLTGTKNDSDIKNKYLISFSFVNERVERVFISDYEFTKYFR